MRRVKCDSGEVCCHQHVGTQSASDRSRVLRRYWGLPSPQDVDVPLTGVGEPEPPGRIVLVIPGVQPQRIVAVIAEANSTSHGPLLSAGRTISARWSNGGPRPASPYTRAATRLTRAPSASSSSANAPLSS